MTLNEAEATRHEARTGRTDVIKQTIIWVAVIAFAWVAGKYGEQFNLPAPHVIVSVIIGLVAASTGLMRRTVPKHLHTAAQAVTGVIIGTFLNVQALGAAGGSLLPLLAVTLATLVLSLAGGLMLARWTGLDQKTASLGMVAGGSAAIVSASEDLGADARMVAFMQYLRLTLVVLTMPLLVRFIFAPGVGQFHGLGAKEVEVPFSVIGMLFLLVASPAGYLLGKLLRMPAPALLGPVLLAAIATVAGIGVYPPEIFREIAFNVIGLEVGLRLNREALRAMGRMLPKVLLFVLAVTGICAALGYLVTLVTNISPSDAYLATTPGGINAVLAISATVHANVALVFTVQTLRLFAMVLLAPAVLKWWLTRRNATTTSTSKDKATATHQVAQRETEMS
ncbi:AbrB family transcriptional regulator [Streptomyces mirabilis]|uniref:AbrB family transcriptional regulator n=1 Tax=Streptomyces mirabilis TaxID=68239 RepID=UPI003789C850